MTNVDITKTEFVWTGKYNEDGTRKEAPRTTLPFQVIETINESRTSREARKQPRQASLFDVYQGQEGATFADGWRNKLVWGENLLVMASLLDRFAGKINLIYIDPPFATGADFTVSTEIGELGVEVTKDASIIEEKAYRDTWGKGTASYLPMMAERLAVMRDLLADDGTIYVHCDWRLDHLIRLLMDDIFGPDCFRNIVIWKRDVAGKGAKKFSRQWPRNADSIIMYSRSPNHWQFQQQFLPLSDEQKKAYRYKESDGRLYKAVQLGDYSEASIARFEADGLIHTSGTGARYKKYYLDEAVATVDCIWTDILGFGTRTASHEQTGYATQKPEDLLERIIRASSKEGDLVADFFSGSGTTMAVAEKLGRRWIGADLGRFAIHTSRKRLLEISNCKPFEILNLGKYERQYWQVAKFGEDLDGDGQIALYEYVAFILKLYGAAPLPALSHLHGKKGKALIHVGAVDSPITIDEISEAIAECVRLKQPELHILGWEWEMGLHELMVAEAAKRGVKLLLLQVPREVMEQQAVDKNDIQFFELAYLDLAINQAKPKKRTVTVTLRDFIIANTDLIPADVRAKVKKWSDYIDYWAIDWDFQNDTFMQGFVTYRTRKDRTLALTSDEHTYAAPGTYRVLVKVIDIFGNDTSQATEVEVR